MMLMMMMLVMMSSCLMCCVYVMCIVLFCKNVLSLCWVYNYVIVDGDGYCDVD